MELEPEARRLLDGIGVLRHPCDLDLLVFFARHPRTLLASEQLAVLLGYEFKQLAASLDVLQGAGLVTRSQSQTYTARMYVFEGDPSSGWLPALLQLATTREGRLAMIRALTTRDEAAPSQQGRARDRKESDEA